MSLRRAWFVLSRWTARLQLCPTVQPDSPMLPLPKIPLGQVKAPPSCHWGLCTLCKCLSLAQTSQNSPAQRALTENGPLSLCMQSHSWACTQRRLAGCGREQYLETSAEVFACVRWVVGNQGNLSLKVWAFALFHSPSPPVQLNSEHKRAFGPGSCT